MISPPQSRAARGLLRWSQEELAARSNFGLSTIRDFEKGRRVPTVNDLEAIKRAIESAGVEFIPENGGGPGVRLAKRKLKVRSRGTRANHLRRSHRRSARLLNRSPMPICMVEPVMVFIECRGVLYRGPARALPKEVWDPQNLQWRAYIGAVPKPFEWGYEISQLQAWRMMAVDQGYGGFDEPP